MASRSQTDRPSTPTPPEFSTVPSAASMDFFTVIAMAIVTVAFHVLPTRSDPWFLVKPSPQLGGWELSHDYDALTHRWVPMTLPWLACGLLVYLVPPVVFLATFYWIRDTRDLGLSCFGASNCVTISVMFTEMLKYFIGGPRPWLLSICTGGRVTPTPTDAIYTGLTSGQHVRVRVLCAETKPALLDQALKSFPSGHTATAFACGTYLSLYFGYRFGILGTRSPRLYDTGLDMMGARAAAGTTSIGEQGQEAQRVQTPLSSSVVLRPQDCFDDGYDIALWKQLLVILPMFGALMIGCSVVYCHWHHWWDVEMGAFMGVFIGLFCYRGVFDGRYPRPLRRQNSLAYIKRVMLKAKEAFSWRA
ncbi:uncharacterized protein K452DRAFT_297156 [Aplosporella prunicola CBS 121167]|uniref:Phosphatidic acid phosphatase type 2/haloperoxidase domain-containing protein n=1 Tax=Aplosporella prunicola CBS 121167 TaxID=1176127 RepID=A0A6A6BGZ0_9PEZI|nr:uncharacterized protein K452DRAFT_297156 [Aplosporella prunicola CBS 121167]KAF2143419.1 hypothetical protein K452DRAFT_297156 [Aplosporella prunicola CBS 121167]